MTPLNTRLACRAHAPLEDALGPSEVRELLAVRDALCARIRERRACLRSALQAAGVGLAEALASAPSSTIQFYLDANERPDRSLHVLRTLARNLDSSPFVVTTAVNAELSSSQRLYLRRQAQRLQALVQALSSVEMQLASSEHRAFQAANR